MSFGNMQYQQHPLLSAISANNYADTQRSHYHPPNPYAARPLLPDASNHNAAYASSGSGHSGYGMEPSVEYEVQHTPPSGSYSSYHSSNGGSSGPAYHPPAPPPPHHHQHHHHQGGKSAPAKKSKQKKSAGSVMSALTLLSFFFFVNMLQSCIKEHIADINPTVMVLTSSGSRNRFNKLAEMNSREQTSSPASTIASESALASASASSSWLATAAGAGAGPGLGPGPIASSVALPVIVTPGVTLHTPYSSGLVTNKPPASSTYQHQHQHQHQQSTPQQPHHYQPHQHHDDYNYGQQTPYFNGSPSSTLDFYPNRTHIDQSLRPDYNSYSNSNSNSDSYYHRPPQQHQQQEHQQQEEYYADSGYAWPPYGSHHANPHSHTYTHGYTPMHTHAAGSKRYSSSASLGAQSGVSSYSDNARYRQRDNDHPDNDDDDYGNAAAAAAAAGGHQRRSDAHDYFYTRIN